MLDSASSEQQPPGDGPTTELVRAANILRLHLDRMVLREFGLHWTGFDILQLVCHRGQVETWGVAAMLGISKGTVTGTTGYLLGRHLIRRRVRPTDRRRVVLTPTGAGLELTRRIRRRVAAEEDRLLRRPSPAIDPHAIAVLGHVADRWPPLEAIAPP